MAKGGDNIIYGNNDLHAFVEEHACEDTTKLCLKYSKSELGFPIEAALRQIELRRHFGSKLPSFISDGCLFPDRAVAEQSTHERVARLHCDILKPYMSGDICIADLTAGLGIDFMALAGEPEVARATAVELNADRADALCHNCRIRGLTKADIICGDCHDVIPELTDGCIVFIDPARRDDASNRVFTLTESTPDIVKLLPEIMKKAALLVVKCSPLLDITQALRQLPGITEVYTVSLRNECKEVLLMIKPTTTTAVTYNAAMIGSDNTTSVLSYELPRQDAPASSKERECPVLENAADIQPGQILCIPDAAVIKLAPWRRLCTEHSLKKLARDTTAFITDARPDNSHNFPGRRFIIEEVLTSARIKKLKGERYNIISLNHPLTPEKFAQNHKIRNGGDNYIILIRAGALRPETVALRASLMKHADK